MERTCADCRFFRVTEAREDSNIGRCRLDKVIGVFRDSMRACPSFTRQGDNTLPTMSNRRSRGPSRARSTPSAPMRRPTVSAERLAEGLQTLEAAGLKSVLIDVLRHSVALPGIELGRQWPGDLTLFPADGGLQPKVVPLDTFFHKLVMIRDNLRVLEQKINGHTRLHKGEKLDLQGRLTRCHAALLSLGGRWVPHTPPEGVDAEARNLLMELIREGEWSDLALPAPAIGDRWRGGRVHYGTAEAGHQEPVERFYHRLVLVRDRLFGLEALLAAHPNVGQDSGLFAGYIRKCYGTLKTFNLLFKDRQDYFSSGG